MSPDFQQYANAVKRAVEIEVTARNGRIDAYQSRLTALEQERQKLVADITSNQGSLTALARGQEILRSLPTVDVLTKSPCFTR